MNLIDPTVSTSEKRLFIIMAGLGLIIYFTLTFFYSSCFVDDSYITFRYSKNLAEGNGLVWNPGEKPIEGYTTFLWMLIMTLPHLVSIDAVWFSRILGILLAVGTMVVGALFCRFLWKGKERSWLLSAGFMFLFFGSLYETVSHSVRGMETMLFSFLLLFLFYSAAMAIRSSSTKSFLLLGILSILTGLTRPEGNLIAVVVISAVFIASKDARQIRNFGILGLTYVLPGVIYFMWRWSYYDLFFPLPFYVKVGGGSFLPGKHATVNSIV